MKKWHENDTVEGKVGISARKVDVHVAGGLTLEQLAPIVDAAIGRLVPLISQQDIFTGSQTTS